MKMKIFFPAILIITFGLLYLVMFKTVDEQYILSHNWKGGGCGLPDVFDFRYNVLRLDGNGIYAKDKLLGRIVRKEYRFYADSYIDVLSEETGSTCTYWEKGKVVN